MKTILLLILIFLTDICYSQLNGIMIQQFAIDTNNLVIIPLDSNKHQDILPVTLISDEIDKVIRLFVCEVDSFNERLISNYLENDVEFNSDTLCGIIRINDYRIQLCPRIIKNEKTVWIHAFCNQFYYESEYVQKRWKYDMMMAADGWVCFLDSEINLTKNICQYFKTNY